MTADKFDKYLIRGAVAVAIGLALWIAALMVLHSVAPRPSITSAQATLDKTAITASRADGSAVPFSVELALTPQEQERGLMFRETMADDNGMLFIFPAVQPVSFWMKNTKIPLDIIFIRADGEIAGITTGLPEDETLLPSPGRIKAVLEINGGLAAKLNLQPGDHISLPAPATSR